MIRQTERKCLQKVTPQTIGEAAWIMTEGEKTFVFSQPASVDRSTKKGLLLQTFDKTSSALIFYE